MKTVGAYEAKTHLAQLLDRVANGETITITRHGVPVAVLRPVGQGGSIPVSRIIGQIKKMRKGRRLDGVSIKEMIKEGRR